MATHSFIRAIAASAPISVLVLTHWQNDPATVEAARSYYTKFCGSFACHEFSSLHPDPSVWAKLRDYLLGRPRHGHWSAEAERILIDSVKSTRSTLVWCNSTFEAKYLAAAKRIGCRTVLTTHNVESELKRREMEVSQTSSLLRWLKTWDVRRLEALGAKTADAVTGITSADIQYYGRLTKADRVLPLSFGYGLDDLPAPADPEREQPYTVLFVGSMQWQPNIEAAKVLVREIMPIVWESMPQATCFLVGRNATDEVRQLSSDRVFVTGDVSSVADYYERASVVVVPIRQRGGLKIKLIEAMAAAKAVVTMDGGAAGVAARPEIDFLVRNDAKSFGEAITQLLLDAGKRRSLGSCGRAFVRQQFNQRKTENQVRDILKRIGWNDRNFLPDRAAAAN
jgi:glycosyltransferase involved in cell wall biosynthesis